jgi:hypothetical protein
LARAFTSVYEAFNYAEGAAWFLIAIILPFWFRNSPVAKRKIIIRASLILIVFGISDLIEASTHARIPAWLWGWKIFCAVGLLKCRYDYMGKERFRWFDRTHILALACLTTVLIAMFLQFYFRHILASE